MSTTYRIALKFTNDDGTFSRSLSINNANPNATKEQVCNFGTGLNGYCDAYTDVTKLVTANLVTTNTTDLLID